MHRYCVHLFAAFAALAFLLVQPANAADYQSPAVGGPGGAPFTMRCAEGDYLVGIRARAGDWVDAIAPLCAHWQGGILHSCHGTQVRCAAVMAAATVISSATARPSSLE